MQIHLEPGRVGELAVKIKDLSHFLYHSTDDLKSKMNQTDWTGLSANDYFSKIHDSTSKIHTLAEEFAKTYWDVDQEQKQWVNVDEQGVNRLKRVTIAPKSDEDFSLLDRWRKIRKEAGQIGDQIEDHRYNEKYQEFVQWWEKRTIEERNQYLQSLQERMADRYGMPKVLVVIDDLLDPENGDARGVNIDGVLIVDVDNMQTNDPWRLIETLFHETRHDYQREVIANYKSDGLIPEGMTKGQVEKWVYEASHYISPTDNFLDYYYQAIEKDARDFGDEVMKDVLSEMGQGGSGGGGW